MSLHACWLGWLPKGLHAMPHGAACVCSRENCLPNWSKVTNALLLAPTHSPWCSGASPEAQFQGLTAAELAELKGFRTTARLIRAHMAPHHQAPMDAAQDEEGVLDSSGMSAGRCGRLSMCGWRMHLSTCAAGCSKHDQFATYLCCNLHLRLVPEHICSSGASSATLDDPLLSFVWRVMLKKRPPGEQSRLTPYSGAIMATRLQSACGRLSGRMHRDGARPSAPSGGVQSQGGDETASQATSFLSDPLLDLGKCTMHGTPRRRPPSTHGPAELESGVDTSQFSALCAAVRASKLDTSTEQLPTPKPSALVQPGDSIMYRLGI